MRAEDFELIIIKDKASGTYCAYPKNEKLSGLIVQVDNIEDIPREIATSFRVMLEMAFEKKMYDLSEL